ncbi:MAG: hypothetical protein IKG72_10775 [Bacillus sp. (in: Bacteria)]|nr:hypothetical protein [Bacillus sp. (in: firmicutes)]
MAKQVRNMVPGQKYRGYGLLNEFGEFEFVPEETGSRKGRVKLVTQGNGYAISMTNKNIIVRININRKGTVLSRYKDLMSKVSEVLERIKEYAF